MTYVANPTDSTRPLDSDDASGGAAELRALKAYLAGLITGGSSFLAYGLAGFRNKIINGNFDRWVRGTALASGTGARMLADRWLDDSVGTTYTPSRQSHTLGQTAVPFEPTFFSRTVVASVAGVGNYCTKTQRIESVRTFAGQTITFSFYAKADAIKDIAIEFVQFFGTGGAPSATVSTIGVTRKTLGTGFQLFTVTAAIPSILGKTLGTAGDDYLACVIWFDAGSNFNARTGSLGQQSGTFDISQIQAEANGVNTPFELLPPQQVDIQCNRYTRLVGVIVGQCFTTTQASAWHNAGTPMRTTPVGSTSAGWTVAQAGGASAGGTVVVGGSANNDFSTIRFDATGAAGLVAGNVTVFTPPAGFYIAAEL